MAYLIKFSNKAQKEADLLEVAQRRRIYRAINKLPMNPRPHDCKKLKGNKNEYRIRVGDYRVVYEIHDNILVIMIVRIAPRDKAYE